MTGWQLQEKEVHCPYCGEAITVLLNPEDVGQDYIEDCQVCCSPFVVTVDLTGVEPEVWLQREDGSDW